VPPRQPRDRAAAAGGRGRGWGLGGSIPRLWTADAVRVALHAAAAAHDAHAMELPDIAARTIWIDALGIPPTQFDLTRAQKAALYASGQGAAPDFLATWTFDADKAWFRREAPEVRRQPGLARPSTGRLADLRRVPGRSPRRSMPRPGVCPGGERPMRRADLCKGRGGRERRPPPGQAHPGRARPGAGAHCRHGDHE
jgi:hypothetical protein